MERSCASTFEGGNGMKDH